MCEVTKLVVCITELPSTYLSHEVSAISAAMDQVPVVVYWTIKTSVACARQITNLPSFGHKIKISQTDAWELSALADKLKMTVEQLQKQIEIATKMAAAATLPTSRTE
ncbi:LRRNT_2 domain-containing protein [Psidium guajava]|nr:LRRNT_2 domain-containing protein [Psidium guajava]